MFQLCALNLRLILGLVDYFSSHWWSSRADVGLTVLPSISLAAEVVSPRIQTMTLFPEHLHRPSTRTQRFDEPKT